MKVWLLTIERWIDDVFAPEGCDGDWLCTEVLGIYLTAESALSAASELIVGAPIKWRDFSKDGLYEVDLEPALHKWGSKGLLANAQIQSYEVGELIYPRTR